MGNVVTTYSETTHGMGHVVCDMHMVWGRNMSFSMATLAGFCGVAGFVASSLTPSMMSLSGIF